MSADGGAIDAATLARAHAELIADRSIQFSLAPPPKIEPSGLAKMIAEFIAALAPFATYIFWAGVALIAAFVAYLVIAQLGGYGWASRWKREQIDDDDADWRPEARVARTLLAEADALAEAGDYEAAVHLLLVRSVEDIARRLPDFLQPSLTARDIAVDARLPARPRDAFSRIAGIVERALFARRSVGSDGWHEARQAYESFAFAEGWRRQVA